MHKVSVLLFLEAVAILVGTIIGGGVFLLPYANIQSGFVLSNLWLILLTILLIIIHLLFGEVILRTKESYCLTGYAGLYLGNHAKKLLLLTSTVSLSFSLIIYLLLGVKFVSLIFPVVAVLGNAVFWLVWLVFNSCIFVNFAKANKLNFILSCLLIFLMFSISFYILPHAKISNLLSHMFSRDWFFSYGIIFYALSGLAAIPLTFQFLREHNASHFSQKVVVFSFVLVALIYFLFMNSIALVGGSHTTTDAISGLIPFLGKGIAFAGALIGLLAVWTSYITFAHYLKNVFTSDMKISNIVSLILVLLLPILFLLLNMTQVEDLMSLVGGIVGALEGIMVLFIYDAAREKSEIKPAYSLNLSTFTLYFIGILFFIGAISQIIWKFVKV